MLQSLHIENYVLIRELDIDFNRGFSVITGETGSGKSILLGALHLLLGGRAEVKVIRDGAKRCVVEAVFDLRGYGMEPFFNDHGMDYEEQCILRREMTDSGKSRLFVNDSPCPAGLVRELGSRLMDIHSQHANLLLKESSFQLSLLDTLAGNNELLARCSEAYRSWRNAQTELQAAVEAARRHREDTDYLRFQYDQLTEAGLTDGEQALLEEEQQTLEHATDLLSALAQAHAALQDEGGALSSLNFADSQLRPSSTWGARYGELYERLHSATIELKDISTELERLQESVDVNPQRLEQVNQRLDLIYTLQQKHQVDSIAGLLEKQREFEQALAAIDHWDETQARLTEAVAQARATLDSVVGELHRRRAEVIDPIVGQLTRQLVPLGVPNARFDILLEETEVGAMGADRAVIRFSANRQMALQPIAQTASGGEIARIMLCIKAMIANSTQLPTILFDEIDTGVSGETAARMAGILREMGNRTQIVCITHLPQIAAKADVHYKVYKDEGEQTETHILQLDEAGRVQEIAKMLSGECITDEAVRNAQSLLAGR